MTMFSTEMLSLAVAGLGVIGVTLTALLTGIFQRNTARAQILKELRLVEINAHTQGDKIVREKFDAFLVEISDLLSQPLVDIESVPTRIRIGRCRRAAFSLVAYGGPNLGLAAITMIEVLSTAYDNSSSGQVPVNVEAVQKATTALTKAFMVEVVQFQSEKRKSLSAAIDGA
jgi:hypothetical protein